MTEPIGPGVGVPARTLGRVAAAVAARPGLWPVALRQAQRLTPRGWWRRLPPRPAPDAALWRFRMETAYGGDGDRTPTTDDIRTYLRWCRRMRWWRRP